MQGKARSLTKWTLGLLLLELALHPLSALAADAPIQLLNHRVIEAEYSKTLDRIVTVSATPTNQLHVYNPVTGEDLAVDMPSSPNCLSVSPDGMKAVVGLDRFISYVDLQAVTLTKTIPVSFETRDIVLAGNGIVYALPRSSSLGGVFGINLETQEESNSRSYGLTCVRLHPNGQSIYGLNNAVTVPYLSKYGINDELATYLYSSPYYGDFCVGSNLWISEDGTRIATECGNVFRSSDDRPQDMVYAGSLGAIAIGELSNSQRANRFAVIPAAGQQPGSDAKDTEVRLYDDGYLNFMAKQDLPSFPSEDQLFASHGRFVFFNSEGTTLFVIVRADLNSGLLRDYGVVTFPVDFDVAQHTISATAGIGGSISPSGQVVAALGDSVSFTITPEAGYELSEVVIDGSPAPTIATHTFESITSNHTIEAVFKPMDNPRLRFLNHRPIDAEYSKSLDRVVTVATQPRNRLYSVDPTTGDDVGVDLTLPPNCVSVSPDGLHAVVGHDGWLSYVDLTTATLLKTISVSADVVDIVLGGNGYAYAFPRNYRSDAIRCINLETEAETLQFGYPPDVGAKARLHPDGKSFYTAEMYSPGLKRIDITGGTAQVVDYGPKQSTSSVCGDLWISEDGVRLFTACGNVFRASSTPSEDMTYNGTLGPIGIILHLDQSAEADEVALVAYTPEWWQGTAGVDTEVLLYEYESLGFTGRLRLPPVRVSGSSYAAHGKFLFFNDAGSSLYAIFATDEVPGKPLSYGLLEYPGDPESQFITIDTIPGPGGAVSPSMPKVPYGESQVVVMTPDPGYEVSDVLVDGVSVGKVSQYTFESVTSGHTLAAVYTRFVDYFGMQLGNTYRYSWTGSPNEGEAQVLDIDTTTFSEPHYVFEEQGGDGTVSKSWYLRTADGLWLKRTDEGYHRLEFSEPLLFVKPSLAGGESWASESTARMDASEVRLRLDASVAEKTLVRTPGGTFLAYPITYRYTLFSGKKKKALPRFTEWFVPYVGIVETKGSGGTSLLSSFAVGGGLITDPPPIVTGIQPSHGHVGDTVTLSGMSFGILSGSATLTAGGVQASDIVSWTEQRIEFRVPPDAVSGPVVVNMELLRSNDDVTFHLDVPPAVAGVAPAEGAPGSVITITGTNFGQKPGKMTVGGLKATVQRGGWSETSIVCKVSKKLPVGTHDVTVSTALGSSTLPAAFTVAAE